MWALIIAWVALVASMGAVSIAVVIWTGHVAIKRQKRREQAKRQTRIKNKDWGQL
jgi:hypothetical protein